MIEQLKTIRAGLETATCYSMLGVDAHSVQIAITALTQLEAMVGKQEPVHWRAVLDPEQVPQQLKTTMHVVGFREKKAAEGFVAEQIDFYGWRYTIEPLYAAPVAQQPSKATLEKLRAWDTSGELIDRAWPVLQSQEQEIMRLEKMLAEERAQQPQAEVVPPGYVLVPVEPTEAMCDAAMAYVYKYGFTRGDGPGSVYRAMIDAAIAQQKGGV